MPPFRLDFDSGQIAGARTYQEDFSAAHVRPDANTGARAILAVLSDGMGGHAAGSLAAELATNTFCDFVLSDNDVGAADEHWADQFHAGLDQANRAIASHISEHTDHEGMGCTFLGVEVRSGSLFWISVGDSPLFLVRGGAASRLNADHSLVPVLEAAAANGEMTWEEARNSSSRNVLRSAVTGDPIKMLDFNNAGLALQPNDTVLLASDGVESLSMDELGELIGEHAVNSPSALVDSILQAVDAKKIPNQDNATVIAIRILEEPAHHGPADGDTIITRPIRR